MRAVNSSGHSESGSWQKSWPGQNPIGKRLRGGMQGGTLDLADRYVGEGSQCKGNITGLPGDCSILCSKCPSETDSFLPMLYMTASGTYRAAYN